ncbi:MAG: hypothetical protein CM1200mP34_3140 [Verrucomicrobiales bacterium]|nr:MAG: hypothetical protein CM1200mP34_3140 [Verrucomicrobiales bacterium]
MPLTTRKRRGMKPLSSPWSGPRGDAVGESATATATIRDDDYAEEEILFADDFSTDTSGDWDLHLVP